MNCNCSWQQIAFSSSLKKKLLGLSMTHSEMTVKVSDRFKMIRYFLYVKHVLKMLSRKWQPFSLGLSVLKKIDQVMMQLEYILLLLYLPLQYDFVSAPQPQLSYTQLSLGCSILLQFHFHKCVCVDPGYWSVSANITAEAFNSIQVEVNWCGQR